MYAHKRDFGINTGYEVMDTQEFGKYLEELNYNFCSGVPCSYLANLINYAMNEVNYVMATNEGEAVAISSGAYLAGAKSMVLMQNSGLTNATSPLTSLNYTFKIPILGFVSLRGDKDYRDEPQHDLMGEITTELLSSMKIPWTFLSNDLSEAKEQLLQADQYIKKQQTFFFVVKKNTFDEVILKKKSGNLLTFQAHGPNVDFESSNCSRYQVLQAILDTADKETLFLGTTGKTGREMFEVKDQPNNLYMVGSMGCVSSLGLGLALNTKKKVICIDGDGSLLMRLGNLATNGYYGPDNFLHILLDNSCHDSTGGQMTVSSGVNFPSLAKACGYVEVQKFDNTSSLKSAIDRWKSNKLRSFFYLKVKPGSKNDLGRPTVTPVQVKERFMKFVNEI